MEHNADQKPTTPANAEGEQQGKQPARETTEKPKRAILVAIAISVVIALALASLLVAHASASGTSVRQPTMLQAVRTPGLNRIRGPMLRIVVDVQSVQRLYSVILKLPHTPKNGFTSCPSDDGTFWTLTFWHGTSVVARVTVNDLGCRFLIIDGHDGRETWQGNFWQVFAATIALPEDQV